MEIQALLLLCIEKQASDLHITENEPPILRIDGKLFRTEFPRLTKQDLKKMIYGVLTEQQKSSLKEH